MMGDETVVYLTALNKGALYSFLTSNKKVAQEGEGPVVVGVLNPQFCCNLLKYT